MIKLLNAIATAILFVKNIIFGRDTKQMNGDIVLPGHINFANKGGEYFHGSKVKFFRTLRGLNEWALPGNEGASTLVSEITPCNGGYMIVYTSKLSKRDEDTIERFGREINAKIKEENDKFAAEELVRQEEQRNKEAEEKRLANVGRAYERRVSHIRGLPAGSQERKEASKLLNSGVLSDGDAQGQGGSEDIV